MNKVYLQYWESSENGWEVHPDGCSLHLTIDEHKKFITNYSDKFEKPVGDILEVEVSKKLFNKIYELGSLKLMQHSFSNLKHLEEIKLALDDVLSN